MGKLLFSEQHVWVLVEDDNTVKLGLSDYAQKKLGAIVFINLPEAGENLEKDVCFGDVESIKTVSDLISPVNGEVLAVNEEILDAPENINADPYANWLLEVRAENLDELMDADAYAVFLEQL